MSRCLREGDFIESTEGLIFDVKGLVHPPDRVVAFVRYIPDNHGTRERNGKRYRKIYDLGDRYEFLKTHYPEYVVYDNVFDEEMSEVPIDRVLRVYQPLEKTRALIISQSRTSLEQKTLEMIISLSEASGVAVENFGVSGSILVGLSGPSSDIDLIVYGSEQSCRVKNALMELLSEGNSFCRYGESTLRRIYDERHRETGVSFEEFSYSETRKSFQGLFKGTDFFVRYVKSWSEVEETYGSVRYRNIGIAEVEGVIGDDRGAHFTPCLYTLNNVKILYGPRVGPLTEIVSFRGRFCEHATSGECIRARGKVESKMVDDKINYRLVLGNTRRDYMVVSEKHRLTR